MYLFRSPERKMRFGPGNCVMIDGMKLYKKQKCFLLSENPPAVVLKSKCCDEDVDNDSEEDKDGCSVVHTVQFDMLSIDV